MSYDLRPLSLGELLDRAFSLYRRQFWVFVGIMALPSLVMLFFSLGMQFVQGMAMMAPDEQPDSTVLAGVLVGIGIALVVTMFLYWITYAVALGATTVAVSEIYMGRTPTISTAYSATRGKTGRLAWLMFLIAVRMFGVLLALGVGVAIAVGALSLISPILGGLAAMAVFFGGFVLVAWMFLRYAVSVPVAVLEDNAASDAIARSIDLTHGSLLRVLVLFVFTLMITYAGLAIFQMPFAIAAAVAGPETVMGFWLNMIGVLTGSIAAALTGPLAVVAMAVLYYDLRIRKEGLDLDLMLAGLRDTPQIVPATSSSAVLPG
jgi:hypothetical protein